MVRTADTSGFAPLPRGRLRKLAQNVWNEAGRGRCDVSLNFVAAEQILELNKTYFSKDRPTDVIAFNLGAGPTGATIGDVYVCVPVASENARRFRCSLQEELARLVVHGILHLAGHEDATRTQKQQMRVLEDAYLEKFARTINPKQTAAE